MGGGDDIQVHNPGTIDLQKANPEAYKELEYLRNNRTEFDRNAMRLTDEGTYQGWKDDAMSRSDVMMQNRYAQMGLAGSSLAMGSSAEAGRRLDMQYDQARLNDLMKVSQMQNSYSNQINQGVYGIQGQFSGYQDQQIQQQIAKQNADNQMWQGIMQLGGTAAGFALGGPPGAAAGSQLGSVAGQGVAPTNTGTFYNGSGNGGYSVGGASGMYGGNSSAYGYGGSY